MEGRLSKIWIIGLRYDGCQINVGEQKIDFTILGDDNLQTPAHGLYSLRNGGGKGVFLQSLFQPLDPLCSWKNGENKIIHFFHNSLGKPVQYTFYVVEEWQVSNNKKIMIGISICPKISTHERTLSKDSLIELDYILFNKTYPTSSDFDIFKLPLWDEVAQEALSLNDWKLMLSNSSEIQYYTPHNKNEYIRFLEENSLDQHTITIMKKLTVAEGNISNYFKGATDNTGIFYNKIIPILNDKIEESDHSDADQVSIITTSFLETLKVAKELPLLLSIIRSIEEIDEFILPLKDKYMKSKDLSINMNQLEQLGSEISILLQKTNSEKLKLKDLKQETYDKLSIEIEKLDWRRENLRYIEACKKEEVLDIQYQELNEEKDNLNSSLESTKVDLNVSNQNILIKKYYQVLSKIKQTKDSISTLEKDFNTIEIQQQLEELKKYFQLKWDIIYENWQQKVTNNYRYNLAHNNKLVELSNSIETENDLRENIIFNIKTLIEITENHKSKQEVVAQKFGDNARLFLDDVIASFETNISTMNNAIISINQTIESKYSYIETTNTKLGTLTNKLDFHEINLHNLENAFQAVIGKEKCIADEASLMIKENINELYTRNDYQQLKQKLELLKENLEDQLKQYNYSLFDLETEMDLIKEGKSENIYIPNRDLVRLKKLLDENQIENMYGSQLLKQSTSDERKFYLSRNPSLPFSVVVLKENLEDTDFSFLSTEIFRSMVIIVDGLKANKLNSHTTINPDLQKISEVNYVPNDFTFVLSTDDYELNKRVLNFEKKLDDLIFTIDDKNQSLSKLSTLKSNIEILLVNKLSRELEKEISDTKQLIQDFTAQKLSIQSDIAEAHKNIATMKAKLLKLESDLNTKKSDLSSLVQWKEECIVNEKNISELKNQKNSLKHSIAKLSELNSLSEKYKSQRSSNENNYNCWASSAKRYFNNIKTLIDDINFPQPLVNNNFLQDVYLNLASYGYPFDNDVYEKYLQYINFLTDKTNKSSIIGKYQSDLDHYVKELSMLEDDLFELDCSTMYQDIKEPAEDLIVLEATCFDLTCKLKDLDNNILSLNSKIDQNEQFRRSVSLDKINIETDLKDRYPEYGATFFNIQNIDNERETIRLIRQNTIIQQNETRLLIISLGNESAIINSLISNFNILHIEPSENINILTEDEKISLLQNPKDFYYNWALQFEDAKKRLETNNKELTHHINRIKDFVDSNENLPVMYKTNLVDFLIQLREMDYNQAIENIDNYEKWAQHNLQQENEQKKKAEDAVNFWSERAARRVLEICQGIEDLEKKMKIKNWHGVLFPLIQIDKSFSYPKKVDDIRFQIKQYCTDMIEELLKKNSDINELSPRQLSKYINMSNIVLHVLGEYPRLKIYIPTIDGPLLRGEPDNSYYKEWEVINHGNATASTKSGGQTLLAQFIVLAMLMRQRADDHSWLFLVSDNPFGTMSAPELVEAVFSLLELLRIQWLVVAPPITNVHITIKFNTVYQMDVEPVDGEIKLVKKLVKKNRKFLERINILNRDENNA